MSAHQPTPGPSNPLVLQPLNAKKRLSSDDPDDTKEPKRGRKDSPVSFASTLTAKDKKKKRKPKRKRKQPIVAVVQHVNAPHQISNAAASASPAPNADPLSFSGAAGVSDTMYEGGEEQEEEKAVLSSSDKGKARATTPIAANVPATEEKPPPAVDESAMSELARVTEDLAHKTALLKRHQTQLNSIHQSLTCEICLDLLYKPFALAPCGHVACHSCLVRWFASPPPNYNDREAHQPPVDNVEQILNGNHGRHYYKKKTCPICRTAVNDRPVEVWGIKSMVGTLVRSNLVDLPVPPTQAADRNAEGHENNNADPWRNIFHKMRDTHRQLHNWLEMMPQYGGNPPEGAREDIGILDQEDGGIYRCIDCLNEIWDGTCTGCRRVYLGHDQHSDHDEDDDEDDVIEPLFGRHAHIRLGQDGRPIHQMIRHILDHESDDNDDLGFGGDFDDEREGVFTSDEEEEDAQLFIHDIMEAYPGHPLNVFRDLVPHYPVRQVNDIGDGIAHLEELDEAAEADVVVYDDGDEEEEGYEGSFIDDEGDGDDDGRGVWVDQPDVINLTESSGEEGLDDDEEDNIQATLSRLRQRRLHIQPEVLVISSEDEDEDEDVEIRNPRAIARRLGRGARIGGGFRRTIADSDEE